MRWTYKSVKLDFNDSIFATGNIDNDEFERVLNYHGWEGWELVNVFDTNAGHGNTRYVMCVFKRQEDRDSI